MRVTVVVVFVVSVVACGLALVLMAGYTESALGKLGREIESIGGHLGSTDATIVKECKEKVVKAREERYKAEYALRSVIVMIGLFFVPTVAY